MVPDRHIYNRHLSFNYLSSLPHNTLIIGIIIMLIVASTEMKQLIIIIFCIFVFVCLFVCLFLFFRLYRGEQASTCGDIGLLPST